MPDTSKPEPSVVATRRMPEQQEAQLPRSSQEPSPSKYKRFDAVSDKSQVSESRSIGNWLAIAVAPALIIVIGVYWWMGEQKESSDNQSSIAQVQREPEKESQKPKFKPNNQASNIQVQKESEQVVQQPQSKPAPEPLYGGINVRSVPPGANVFVNDKLLGVTPVNLKSFEAGRTATVRLQLEGYEQNQQVVTAPNKGSRDVTLTLKKIIQKYALTINAEPADATVRILNIESRYNSGMLLEPGRYHVEVSKSGYVTETRWMEIAGQAINQLIALKPASFSLTIQATPSDADIRLLEPEREYLPGMFLPPGSYRYEVSRKNYKTKISDVALSDRNVFERVDLASIWTPGAVFRDCPSCPEMVVIQSGSFMMGSLSSESIWEDEKPRHRVTINHPFAMGKFEITLSEFKDFVAATGHQTDAERNSGEIKGCIFSDKSRSSYLKPGWKQSSSLPVVCISWNDANAYVSWLARTTGKSYRLPSEAEWEYAARAGTTTKYWWGDDEADACRFENLNDLAEGKHFGHSTLISVPCDDGHIFTSPVGSYRANSFGLYDMSGNASEWLDLSTNVLSQYHVGNCILFCHRFCSGRL